MQIRELLLPEFDCEMQKTRSTLERVPEGDSDFKPHEKSTSIARLAGHLAQLPSFGEIILTTPELDFANSGRQPLVMQSRQQLLQAFDDCVQKARTRLAAASDDDLNQHWKLSFGGKTILEGSRREVLRTLLMNHMIHHRAQLGVYLRLKNVPVPSIYGPSADEQ